MSTPDKPPAALEPLCAQCYRKKSTVGECQKVNCPHRKTKKLKGTMCVRCNSRHGDRVVIGTGWICCYCATDDEVES